jgi:hypothetical protein
MVLIENSMSVIHLSSKRNHHLLTKLGFARIRAPNSPHTKRLAVESRHHSRSDDSNMFVIKLPPNQHYYAQNHPQFVQPEKKVPVGFKGNGKPGKIYHWNIPVIKKVIAAKSKGRLNDSHIFDVKLQQNNWNEVLDKQDTNVSKKAKKPAYYVPYKPKKSNYLKYFPGNGKPKAFYVMEKNKKKHHYKLLD